jgi:hypothetical protein
MVRKASSVCPINSKVKMSMEHCCNNTGTWAEIWRRDFPNTKQERDQQ